MPFQLLLENATEVGRIDINVNNQLEELSQLMVIRLKANIHTHTRALAHTSNTKGFECRVANVVEFWPQAEHHLKGFAPTYQPQL